MARGRESVVARLVRGELLAAILLTQRSASLEWFVRGRSLVQAIPDLRVRLRLPGLARPTGISIARQTLWPS